MQPADLLTLQRLARAAHEIGHYNLAKLLNAGHLSLSVQAMQAQGVPRNDQQLIEALAQIEPALAVEALPADWREALGHLRDAIARGEMALAADAPPVFVCRACGRIALDAAPPICPACGAGQLTFQEVGPTYYLEPEAPAAVLAHLSAMPEVLDSLLAGLSDDQAAQAVPGAEGEWSLSEAAAHLLDSNRLIAGRVELLLTNDEPDLKAQATWGEAGNTAAQGAAAIAAAFRRERGALVARLSALTPDQWLRAGRHTEFGRVTLVQQAGYFAKHEHWHLAQMTRIRAALLAA